MEFSASMTFCHSGLFLQMTHKPISILFHMCVPFNILLNSTKIVKTYQ